MTAQGFDTHVASAAMPTFMTCASVCPNPACRLRRPAPSGIRTPAGRINGLTRSPTRQTIRREADPRVALGTRLLVGPWMHADVVRFPDGSTGDPYRRANLNPWQAGSREPSEFGVVLRGDWQGSARVSGGERRLIPTAFRSDSLAISLSMLS